MLHIAHFLCSDRSAPANVWLATILPLLCVNTHPKASKANPRTSLLRLLTTKLKTSFETNRLQRSESDSIPNKAHIHSVRFSTPQVFLGIQSLQTSLGPQCRENSIVPPARTPLVRLCADLLHAANPACAVSHNPRRIPTPSRGTSGKLNLCTHSLDQVP